MAMEADKNSRRVAIVTGAASGIGRAVAASLLESGFLVGALDRSLPGIPEGVEALEADVRDSHAVARAVDAFCGVHGALDLLVNNAAVSHVGTVEEDREEDWQRVFDINVFGQMRTMRAALPWLRKSSSPSVVVMSSCSAINGIPRRSLYSASKGAVHSWAHAMAVDLLEEGIRVNCIAPATVDTPLMADLIGKAEDPDAQRRAFEMRQPTGRMIDPEEIAKAVLHLADPACRSTTGTTLVVDGGMGTLRPVARP